MTFKGYNENRDKGKGVQAMYERILVALDRSPMAQLVFDSALFLAKKCDSQLNLLHVISQEVAETPLVLPLIPSPMTWK